VFVDGIHIVNLYVPNGSSVGSEKYEYKLRWLEGAAGILAITSPRSQRSYVSVVISTFTLENRDIHNPAALEGQIMASELERQALREILEWGLLMPFENSLLKADTSVGGTIGLEPSATAWAGGSLSHYDLYKAKRCIIDISPKLPKPSDHASGCGVLDFKCLELRLGSLIVVGLIGRASLQISLWKDRQFGKTANINNILCFSHWSNRRNRPWGRVRNACSRLCPLTSRYELEQGS